MLTLAIAIGANTAIFSLLNVLVFRDLPVRDPGGLVQFRWQYPGDPPLNLFSAGNYAHVRDHNTVFSDLIGVAPVSVPGQTGGAAPEPINVGLVTGNFFQALGVQPAAGRPTGAGDDDPGADAVAVLNWTYWKTRFNLDPGVFNTRIVVGPIQATVVGVAARDFSGLILGHRSDVWIPAAALRGQGQPGFMLMGRLKQGVTLDRARAEMRVLDRPRIEAFARSDPQWRQVALETTSARTGFTALGAGRLRIARQSRRRRAGAWR